MKTANRTNKVSYNKSEIMKRAWVLFRNNKSESFSDALIQSWNIAKNKVNKITFDHAYKTYYNDVLRYISYRIYDQLTAEELTQDIFIKINEHLNNYDVHKAKFKTYLYTIVKNKLIDYFRKNAIENRKNIVKIDSYVNEENGKEFFQLDSNVQTDSEVNNNDLSIVLDKLINSKLNEKERQILNLYFFENKKYLEIAEVLDIPMNTVKGTLNRAKSKMKQHLEHTEYAY